MNKPNENQQSQNEQADIDISGVYQSFAHGFLLKPKTVLTDINLKVPSGSVFGFLGANGAGKTTLIHLITGIRKPKQGKALILGHEAHTKVARKNIGYLPERPYFQEHLTAEQLLQYFGTLSGLNDAQIQARIPQVLATVGMSQARNLELSKYSKGMLQRVGIAAAILHEPQVLILDEPMSGLDPVGRKEIRELILNLKKSGKTLFFSTHVVSDVEAICDEVAIIRKGQIQTTGNVEEMLSTVSTGLKLRWMGAQVLNDPGILKMGDTYSVTLASGVDPNPLLAQLISKNAKILEVNVERASLENYFGDDSFARTH